MKVLRIAGENLASFEQFEVDFTVEPLRSASRFAITGPTGAGKSTLLDALCLALYDKTPRLTSHGGVAVVDIVDDRGATQKLGANDACSILRRGAGYGWSEVDFLGSDGGRYRSRWAVQRAGRKPSGTMGNQVMTVWQLGPQGEVLQTLSSTRKTETLKLLVTKVGLEFDQFRRAVVLAQGDFAAFLKAPPAERATLLERMTDTGIYAELSRQAWEEHRLLQERETRLRDRLAGLQVLSEAERAGIVDTLQTLRTSTVNLRAQLTSAQAALHWHESLVALRTEQAAAQQQAVEAVQATVALAGVQAELTQVIAAQPLRGVADAALAARTMRGQRAQAAAEAEAVAQAAEQVVADGQGVALQAADRLARLEHDFLRTEEDLRRARAMDAALVESRRIAQAAAEQAAGLGREVEASLAALAADARALQTQQEEIAAIDAWLAGHAPEVALAGQARPMMPFLTDAAALQARFITAGRNMSVAQTAAATAQRALEGQRAQLATAQSTLDALRDTAQGLRLRAAAGNAAELHRQQVQGQQTKEVLVGLQTLVQRFVSLQAEDRALDDEVNHNNARIAAERDVHAIAVGQAATLTARLDEARQALQLWQSAQALADLRQHLVDGEPCPLCGATAHPWHQGLPVIHDQQARIAQLQAELTAVQTQVTASQTIGQQLAQRNLVLADARRELQDKLHLHGEAWARLVATGPQPHGLLHDPEVPGELAAALAQVQAELDGIGRALRDVAAMEEQARAAAEAVDQQAGQVEALKKASDEGQLQGSQREREAALAEAAYAEADRAWQDLSGRVDGLLDGRPAWRALWTTDAGAVARAIEALIAQIDVQSSRRTALQAEAQVLTVAVRGGQGQAQALQAQLQQRQLEAQASAAQLAQAEAARQGVLGGQLADDVEQAARAKIASATAELVHLQDLARAATVAAAQRRVQWQTALDELRTAEAQHVQTEAALATSLTEVGWTEAALHTLLARPFGWIGAQQAILAAAQERVDQTRGALSGCEARLTAHEAHGPPALSQEGAALTITHVQAELEQVALQSGRLTAQLDDDDVRRVRTGSLQDRLARHAEFARPWAQICDLLGSSSGNDFRVYAQGLTLDVLVALANRHLAELARRYRLQRVPGADLELQVIDGDMANEVRALTTLSGGETFLVSLALALGLSALSTRAIAIESLFIDEGFGTLDPETLDVAMAVLDGLGDAGRTVGIISHVPGLAEHVGVEVAVRPRGAGLSRLTVRRASAWQPAIAEALPG